MTAAASQTAPNAISTNRFLLGPSAATSERLERQPTVVETREAPPWLMPVVNRLNALVHLPDGWDSYGAHPTAIPAGEAAIRLLASNAWTGPTPSITPEPDGGVVLEWNQGDCGIEMWIDPDGVVTAVVDDNGAIHEYAGLSVAGAAVRSLLQNVLRW